MSDQDIRTNIKRLMESIPGIGKVHDYVRYAVTGKEKKDTSFFVDSDQPGNPGKVLMWEITQRTFTPERLSMDIDDGFQLKRDYVIDGFYGLEDENATEKLFMALIEVVVLTFANKPLSIGVPTKTNKASSLDDFHTAGQLTSGTAKTDYIFKISTAGTPDKFQYSTDDEATFSLEIDITGSSQEIANGIRVYFDKTTGHSVNDKWAFTVLPVETRFTAPIASPIEARMWSNTLMHHTTLSFSVWEQVLAETESLEDLLTLHLEYFTQEPTPPDSVPEGSDTITF